MNSFQMLGLCLVDGPLCFYCVFSMWVSDLPVWETRPPCLGPWAMGWAASMRRTSRIHNERAGTRSLCGGHGLPWPLCPLPRARSSLMGWRGARSTFRALMGPSAVQCRCSEVSQIELLSGQDFLLDVPVPLALRHSGARLLGPHLAGCTGFPSATPGTEQNVLSLPSFPTATPVLPIWTHGSLISVRRMSISSRLQPASHLVQNKPWRCQVCSTHVEKTKLVVLLLFFRLFKNYFLSFSLLPPLRHPLNLQRIWMVPIQMGILEIKSSLSPLHSPHITQGIPTWAKAVATSISVWGLSFF